MSLYLMLSRACNHFYIKRTHDAKYMYCNSTISLQAYERWKREKDKKKKPPQR
jgi:hypothetical protein